MRTWVRIPRTHLTQMHSWYLRNTSTSKGRWEAETRASPGLRGRLAWATSWNRPCLQQGGKHMLALSLTSSCHVRSMVCPFTREFTSACKRIMLATFSGIRLREENCSDSLWNIELSLLVGNNYMESWWLQCKMKYFPRESALKKSCPRSMEYLLLLIAFQVKSTVFVHSWPQVRNINYSRILVVVHFSFERFFHFIPVFTGTQSLPRSTWENS